MRITKNVNDPILDIRQGNLTCPAFEVSDSNSGGVGVDITSYGTGEALDVYSKGGCGIWALSNESGSEEAIDADAYYDNCIVGYYHGTSSTRAGVRGQRDSYGYGVYYVGGLGGSGEKNAIVRTSKGPVAVYCQESPENWFEDFGEGKLNNGYCRIKLDDLFLETVTINEQYPMKVFIQLRDNCNGSYVKTKLDEFDVLELQNGKSNAEFSYRVVAKRKGFENFRLEKKEVGYTDEYLYPDLNDPQIPLEIRQDRLAKIERNRSRQLRLNNKLQEK